MTTVSERPDRATDWTEIATVDELVALLGEPGERAGDKARPALLDVDRDWLAASPFCVMATAGRRRQLRRLAQGRPGRQLVHVIDDRTIALAERPGNRRADGYRNILANPHVGLNFLIPGRGDTLRINGRARLVSDAPFFDEMVVKGHRPLLAVVVDIDDLFFHCAKAFLRSGLWKPETWDPEATVPRRAVIAERGRADRDDRRAARRLLQARELRAGASMAELPLPQGPRHRERLRAAARPRRHVHGDLTPERVRALCDRRAGIGGDGVIRAVARTDPRAAAWFMDYRNSDGSVTEMCGNGIRLFGRYLATGRVASRSRCEVGTRDGVKTLTEDDGGLVTVDLGSPRLLGETKVAVDGRSWPATPRRHGQPARRRVRRRPRRRRAAARPADHDPAVYPDGVNVEFVVRRGDAPRRDAGPRARLGRDPLLRHRRLRGDGGRGDGRRRVAAGSAYRVDVPGGTLTVTWTDRRPGAAHRPGRHRRRGHHVPLMPRVPQSALGRTVRHTRPIS